MKGDFSRLRFSPSKNYVAVLQQQGRVALDADANEQCAINDYLRDTETRDFVGRWGGPETDCGFDITFKDGGIWIGKGRYYVEGILCENDALRPYWDQPFLVAPDTTAIHSGILGTIGPGIVVQVYLEVWRRLVTGLDDPCLLEPAIGQADTTVRLQTVWRVVAESVPVGQKVAAPAPSATGEFAILRECTQPGCSDMTNLTLPRSTGQMMVPPITSSGDCSCQPTPAAGYRGVENQLYRVEIHTGGDQSIATFKWSRENASVVVAVTGTSGYQVYVDSLGFDANLGFCPGQWIELTDDSYEFGQTPNQPGNLYQIDTIFPDQLYVTLKQSVPAGTVDPTKNARMRRWDQFGSSAVSGGVPISVSSPAPLENGIEVQFTNGKYVSGDYWLIPARTAKGEVEWPPCESNGNPCQPPYHIEIYRAPLANLQFDDKKNGVVAYDCRSLFPALTEIKASDVWFTPRCSQLETACNVQEAIDLLCDDVRGPCTIVPKPGAGWESPILKLAAGQDADICFPVGKFPLTKPLLLKGLGNLRISGGGPGTSITGTGITAAMIFFDCTSVKISDLSASTDRAQTRAQRSGGALGLTPGGTLSFLDCPDVEVSDVWLQCGYGQERTTACISVAHSITTANKKIGQGHVRIRHCNLSVGRNQDGILLVQVQRAEVEDNILTTYTPKHQTFLQLLEDRNYRADAMREFMAEIEFVKVTTPAKATGPAAAAPAPPATGTTPPTAPPAPAPDIVVTPLPIKLLHPNTTVTAGGYAISFRTHPLLKTFWQTYVTANAPKQFATNRDLVVFIKDAALKFLMQPAARKGNSAAAAAIAALERSDQVAMGRGICVGGEGVQECRILNNSIQDAVQGITVGMSDHKLDPRTRESASVVTISGNQIYVGLPPGAQFHARHAIFVGNVDSLVIDNNYAAVLGTNPNQVEPLEAIWVYGLLGRRLIVRDCHMVGFSTGIVVQPLQPYPEDKPLWYVLNNMAEKAKPVVRAPSPPVIESNNLS
jgi:hypothetical protein